MSKEINGLYRRTVIVWTAFPADGVNLTALARQATEGDAYCSAQQTVLVPCPEADPAPPGPVFFDLSEKVAIRLLCDRCFEAVTGEEGLCRPGCRHKGLDDDGACLWPEGPTGCQWCGCADRLTSVPRDHEGFRNLPTVAERDEGQWWLNWPGEEQGPYPSPDAAWHIWHANSG